MLAERWFELRNRLLASPAFQSWASAFPLTRPIARRRAKAAFDLTAGFVYSQVLLANWGCSTCCGAGQSLWMRLPLTWGCR